MTRCTGFNLSGFQQGAIEVKECASIHPPMKAVVHHKVQSVLPTDLDNMTNII